MEVEIREKPMFSLATARDMAGLSQKDAAAELGISSKTLIEYEKGRSSPRTEVVEKMSEMYGIPIENLIINPKGFDLSKFGIYGVTK